MADEEEKQSDLKYSDFEKQTTEACSQVEVGDLSIEERHFIASLLSAVQDSCNIAIHLGLIKEARVKRCMTAVQEVLKKGVDKMI